MPLVLVREYLAHVTPQLKMQESTRLVFTVQASPAPKAALLIRASRPNYITFPVVSPRVNNASSIPEEQPRRAKLLNNASLSAYRVADAVRIARSEAVACVLDISIPTTPAAVAGCGCHVQRSIDSAEIVAYLGQIRVRSRTFQGMSHLQ